MINITICDDEHTDISYVTGLVKDWAAGRDLDVRLAGFDSAESFLFAYEDNKAVDILLLDIQMKNMDGVTLARQIRAENKEVQIVFITGFMDYIADGYDVEALHYLMKPVTAGKLIAVLDRALTRLSQNERALFVSHAGESVRIPLGEIRYLEVMHNYVTIHAGSDNFTVKKTLSKLEKALDGNFFRTGRSFIVNLRHIKAITKNEVRMVCGATIPLSRGLYDALNRAVIERL